MRNRFLQLLDSEPVILLDGAMGTMLFRVGLNSGDPPELWNVTQPEKIQAIHRAYVEAGSDLILTNSFGGTAYRLKLHQLDGRVEELNRAAAVNARAAADAVERPVVVAGSMGPSGELLVPMGTMTYEACRDAFAAQARGLASGGVDVLWIETMSDLNEVRAAYEGARSVTDLPICATLSFDTSGRTMMGVTGTQAVEALADLELAAIGANCGNNLADTEAVLAEMHAVDPTITLIAKANAGIPEWHGADLVYNGTPDVMAGYAQRVRTLGVRLIGGCCGSSPEHVGRMRAALAADAPILDVAGFGPVAETPRQTQTREPARRRRRRRR